jgi:hypothetical protein
MSDETERVDGQELPDVAEPVSDELLSEEALSRIREAIVDQAAGQPDDE